MKRITQLWPSKLKNRIFITFLFIIFIPFSIFQIYNYNQIENAIGRKISQQNVAQLQLMKEMFNVIRWSAQSSIYKLEADEAFLKALHTTDEMSQVDGEKNIQEKLAALKSAYLPDSVFTHYTVVTSRNNIYHSFTSKLDAEKTKELIGNFNEAIPEAGDVMLWQLQAHSDLYPEVFIGNSVLSLYSQKKMESGENIRIRASIDLEQWLSSTANSMQIIHNYYFLDSKGEYIAQNLSGPRIDDETIPKLLEYGKSSPEVYVSDKTGAYILNAIYVPTIQGYIVGQFPLEYFIGDINEIKHQAFLSLLLLFFLFAAISFLMLSGLTRPLQLLELKMKESAEKRLNIKLPEKRYRGEILSFIRSFNDMIDNINQLIGKVKQEERQKEANRFHMLLTQMNPHFLFNSLNTIKWNASNFGDETTAEMCRALGRILENSMNTETDLVFLKDELELLKAFVYIQTIRYDHRFDVLYEIASDVEYSLVPKFSLQPLVENAILHGLVHRKQDGQIKVSVFEHKRYLILEVMDNGIGIDKKQADLMTTKRKGIALNNLKERLALLYRVEGTLDIVPQSEGTLVRIKIPLLISVPYVQDGSSKEMDDRRKI